MLREYGDADAKEHSGYSAVLLRSGSFGVDMLTHSDVQRSEVRTAGISNERVEDKIHMHDSQAA